MLFRSTEGLDLAPVGDDVEMGDADAEGMDPIVSQEYEPLKRCFEGFKDRLEANSWTHSVLASTY